MATPGSVHLPQFLHSRLSELTTHRTAIDSLVSHRMRRAFQSVPRWIRRRAASHNPSRVPTRMRQRAKSEQIVNGSADKVGKMRKRKARQRLSLISSQKSQDDSENTGITLNSRFLQLRPRASANNWLETHLWHTKRFHISRPSPAAANSTQNCLLTPIPLRPTQKSHRAAVRAIANGVAICDMSYNTVMFVSSQDANIVQSALREIAAPNGPPISSTRYTSGARSVSTVLYSQWPQVLIGPCELLWLSELMVQISIHWSLADELSDLLRTRFPALVLKTPKGNSRINLFRLYGPRAPQLLAAVCKPVDGKYIEEWEEFSQSSIASLPSGLTISAVVSDPRLSYPPKTGKSLRKSDVSNRPLLVPSCDLARKYAIDWSSTQQRPTFTKSQLDKRRYGSSDRLPGERLPQTSLDDKIPILVVKSTHQYLTIHVPPGWGMYFWSSFVYSHTTVVLGLDQVSHAEFEDSGVGLFPAQWPGTLQYKVHEREEALRRRIEWEKKPPSKRTGDPTFRCIWKRTVQSESLPWLLHNPPDLKLLVMSDDFTSELRKIMQSQLVKRFKAEDSPHDLVSDSTLLAALVMVRLNFVTRAAPENFDKIRALSRSDVDEWMSAVDARGEDGVQDLGNRQMSDDYIGYATHAGFSLTRGCGHALGAVSFYGLLNALHSMKNSGGDWRRGLYVTVGGGKGQIARLAKIELIND